MWQTREKENIFSVDSYTPKSLCPAMQHSLPCYYSGSTQKCIIHVMFLQSGLTVTLEQPYMKAYPYKSNCVCTPEQLHSYPRVKVQLLQGNNIATPEKQHIYSRVTMQLLQGKQHIYFKGTVQLLHPCSMSVIRQSVAGYKKESCCTIICAGPQLMYHIKPSW